ncbi:helix-turn-helix domain-containing protein [Streptomyces sp. NPDC050803]|uniref:helix-turn-helix domain-containing protein n=1 Tax=unclassified Streptomyces TaxID=2593676 RepID=UPI00341F9D08
MRLQAAELFEQKAKPPEIARRLRVSRKTAHQWQQLWRKDAVQALASRGASGSRCRLSALSEEAGRRSPRPPGNACP